MWFTEINKIAHEANLEIITENDKIYIYGPKISESIKKKLIRKLPIETTYEFIEGPKPLTSLSLRAILSMSGIINAEIKVIKKSLEIEVISGISINERLFDELNNIIQKDGYFDSWTFIHNNTKRTSYFNLNENRPVRDTSILKDEITDLIITLNTISSIDEFIELI